MEEKEEKEKKREIVVPGEIMARGEEWLPGEHTEKRDNLIITNRFGLAEIEGRLVRVIPISGVYMPRKGNVVIGKIIDVTYNGWIVDIEAPYLAFLSISECGKYVDKTDLTSFLDIGDVVAAKILAIKHRSIDITTKQHGLGKLEQGLIIKVNSNKVPRIIGREGSMINMIKKETACNIIVGQNGIIWISGKSAETELLAKNAIMLITKKSFVEGLTEKVKDFLKK